ncbi:hypothetical protein FIBSPDRAFT_10407 [Athelia psychrophila]|uniref:Uncharacterized protein n=1 Tax=Athelia psychrophila TaxID=1759441 RepID=A0A166X7U3_9AGAM|nr:hypothetical protein FIBSPDRAFT_10407 [Fibularhizoctonia sp. CBS 109695]
MDLRFFFAGPDYASNARGSSRASAQSFGHPRRWACRSLSVCRGFAGTASAVALRTRGEGEAARRGRFFHIARSNPHSALFVTLTFTIFAGTAHMPGVTEPQMHRNTIPPRIQAITPHPSSIVSNSFPSQIILEAHSPFPGLAGCDGSGVPSMRYLYPVSKPSQNGERNRCW